MCYSCKVRSSSMQSLLVAIIAVALLSSCRARRSTPSAHETSAAERSSEIERSEQRAAERDADRECERPIPVYDGSIAVNSSDYVQPVAHGDDFVDETIEGLDRIVTTSTRVRFTLDYPFERPFTGVIEGEITLRRTIDAIRAGFRKMYERTTERDIPGMHNKNVTGPYGQAFHAIEDLVIERIDVCADESLSIAIGS